MQEIAIRLILYVLAFLPGLEAAIGQEMLIEQVAGKEVVRTTYNERDELTSKQVFEVSPLSTNGDRLSVELGVRLYNSDGNLTDIYTTQYTCEPPEADILLTVFPSAQKKDAEFVIEASSPGFRRLYDIDPGEKTMKDLNLEMSLESGMLGFFGSKSLFSLTDRSIESEENGYTLKSTLTIEAYLLGLRVKTVRYRVTEKLDTDYRLLNQMFRTGDGPYFTIKYLMNE